MRSLALVLAALGGASFGSVALAAEPANVTLDAKFVSFTDNGSGNTLEVKAGRKKVLFFMPPDGSGKGLENLAKGDALTVTYQNTIEERVFRAKRGACPRRNPKRVFCASGTLKKIVNGDMGLYFHLEQDGKEVTWLADFEPKGNVKEKRDAGKTVAVFYRKKPKKTFVSFQRAGAAPAAEGSAPAPASAP